MTIVVAGATGNLGGRIVKALAWEGANVKALVRKGTTPSRVEGLRVTGVETVEIDLSSRDEWRPHVLGLDV